MDENNSTGILSLDGRDDTAMARGGRGKEKRRYRRPVRTKGREFFTKPNGRECRMNQDGKESLGQRMGRRRGRRGERGEEEERGRSFQFRV